MPQDQPTTDPTPPNLYTFGMGNLEGVFFATAEEVSRAIGKEIYFGEVLGKHSEISGTLDAADVEVRDIPPEDLAVLWRYREDISSGFDPLAAIRCEGCEDYGFRLGLDGLCTYCQAERSAA